MKNLHKRLRRERRSATRREKRQLEQLYLLQNVLMWLQQKELGITNTMRDEVALLQALLFWTQGTAMFVYKFGVRRHRHRSNTTLCELEHTRLEPVARKHQKPRVRFTPEAVRRVLQRRTRYRGGRKARAAGRRLRSRKGTYMAAILGIGGLLYGAMSLFSFFRYAGQVGLV